MLGSPSSDLPSSRRSGRASRARADLLRARGITPAPCARPRAPRQAPGLPLRALLGAPHAAVHAGILSLVTLILVGELVGGWSAATTVAPPRAALSSGDGPPAEAAPVASLSLAPLRLVAHSRAPDAPAFQRPREVADAYQAHHPLAEGETLGAVAARYGVSLGALVWSNGLDRGDALMVGQLLRVPRVSGLPHVVAEGETLEAIAERFGVGPEAIATFAPNRVGPDLGLEPGLELFIPGGERPEAGDWLRSLGGLDGLAGRGPVPAGVVRAAQTNLRSGPSIEHPRLIQLDAGRQVALRARHEDWVQVELGAALGWMRQDMIEAPASWLEALPVTTDFPEPPPRWVWPARGSISSRYGPRWGGFHNGLDIANRAWTPIVAARAGTVSEAGWCSGYGYCVRLRHGGGVETIYGHLIARPVVRRGDEVAAGELIGHMGSTYDRAGGGYSTGVHLHFTVNVNGRAVDPLRFLP